MIDVGAGEAALRTVGTGPEVLFVHGWPVSGATFRLLLPHLVDQVTCHVIDFPSTGSSRFDNSTPMSIDQHIETVRRVVDALDVESVAVVGHDSGGMIARHALAGDPRMRAMGLINTEPAKPGWRFTSFAAAGGAPGLAKGLQFIAGSMCRSSSCGAPRIRSSRSSELVRWSTSSPTPGWKSSPESACSLTKKRRRKWPRLLPALTGAWS